MVYCGLSMNFVRRFTEKIFLRKFTNPRSSFYKDKLQRFTFSPLSIGILVLKELWNSFYTHIHTHLFDTNVTFFIIRIFRIYS